jgi:hypothetical protein
MKIGERVSLQDDRLIWKKTFTADPALTAARAMRDREMQTQGESKVVGVVPYALWLEWAKRAGVRPDDHDAMKDVLHREMANPDNKNLRVWTGAI